MLGYLVVCFIFYIYGGEIVEILGNSLYFIVCNREFEKFLLRLVNIDFKLFWFGLFIVVVLCNECVVKYELMFWLFFVLMFYDI